MVVVDGDASDTALDRFAWESVADFVGACDGRPVYGIGGLDGLDERIGGQETTSRDWTDSTDGSLHVAKVRVAGSNPVVRSKKV